MRRAKISALLVLSFALCLGCKSGKPEGIPKLFPASVTLVKSGTPIANANILLVPADGTPSGSWSVAGVTDASGRATLETSQGDWKASGAPQGEYKFYVTKLAQIEEPEKPADIDTNEEAKEAYFAERLKRLEAASKEIPKSLNSAETSNLTLSVAEGAGGSTTVDVDEYAE